MLVPSAFITSIASCASGVVRLKATREPSGDQEGEMSLVNSEVNARTSEPSGNAVYRCQPSLLGLINVIRPLNGGFGSEIGCQSGSSTTPKLLTMVCRPVPSAFMIARA